MNFFGMRKEKIGYGALIDISSGSIGIAIISIHAEDMSPQIIYSARDEIRFSVDTMYEMITDTRRAREAILASALTLAHEGVQALTERDSNAIINQIFVTCSSPWAYTVARNVQYESKDIFKITKSVVSDLIRTAEQEVLEHIRKHDRVQKHDYEVIEKATVDITINDYLVTQPYGLRGTTLGLSHIVGLIPKEILQTIYEVKEKLFAGSEIRAHTSMLVMYCVIRDLFPKIHSTCIIDITGEATEFGIVENNLLIDNSYIPYGTNTFLREMSSATKRPIPDIITTIRDFATNGVQDSTRFEPAISSYSTHVQTHIQKILENRVLPGNVMIIAPAPFTSLFKKIFEDAYPKVFDQTVTCVPIDENLISKIDHSSEIEHDVYLAMIARFFHKLHKCGENDVDD